MLDKNEAPEGFEAVEYRGELSRCEHCAFNWFRESEKCFENPCQGIARYDRTHVYFVRRTSNMSALLHPMGSLGEEV